MPPTCCLEQRSEAWCCQGVNDQVLGGTRTQATWQRQLMEAVEGAAKDRPVNDLGDS